MTFLQSLPRVAIAAVVALSIFTPVANAQGVGPQAVVVPNSKKILFNLAPGASTTAIGLPPNVPVQLTGVTTTSGFRGIGHVSLLRVTGQFVVWVGLDSTTGAAITQGFSGTPGTKILFIDFSHQVIVEVSGSDAILVRNASAGQRAGSLHITW
jgi:hypothetical protein